MEIAARMRGSRLLVISVRFGPISLDDFDDAVAELRPVIFRFFEVLAPKQAQIPVRRDRCPVP